MALTTTTLNGAVTADQTTLRVTSGSGFGKGKLIRIDDEECEQTADADSASTTIIPVMRGVNGSVAKAHVTTANVIVGNPYDDFGGDAVATAATYPLAGRQRRVLSYAASGAITLPSPGTDGVAILIGTSTLAMTVAAPTKDMDGCVLSIFGNAKSASTVDFANGATLGLNNAGASYDLVTFQTAGTVGIQVMAINGAWCVASAPAFSGTATALTVAIT